MTDSGGTSASISSSLPASAMQTGRREAASLSILDRNDLAAPLPPSTGPAQTSVHKGKGKKRSLSAEETAAVSHDSDASVLDQVGENKRRRPNRDVVPVSFRDEHVRHSNPKHLNRKLVVQGVAMNIRTLDGDDAGVVWDLLSFDEDKGSTHDLHIKFCGPWALPLANDELLKAGKTVRLAFKEAVLLPLESSAASGTRTLEFARGCEFWIPQSTAAYSGEEVYWKKIKTFAAAKVARNQSARADTPAQTAAEPAPLGAEAVPAVLPDGAAGPTPQDAAVLVATAPVTPARSQSTPQAPSDWREESTPARTLDVQPMGYKTFEEISKLPARSLVCVIAVVKEEPAIRITLQNHTSSTISLGQVSAAERGYDETMSATLMQPDERLLPSVGEGDVIILKNIKTQEWHGNMKLIAYSADTACAWAVLRRAQGGRGPAFVLSSGFPDDGLSEPEKQQARALQALYLARGGHSDLAGLSRASPMYQDEPVRWASPALSLQKREDISPEMQVRAASVVNIAAALGVGKLRKLRELKEPRGAANPTAFFDVVIEVVQPVKHSGSWLQIFVSDWTQNELFIKPSMQHFPPEQEECVFRIDIYKAGFSAQKLAQFERELGDSGSFIFIEGLRVKSYNGGLHGHIGESSRDFKSTKLAKGDPRLRELLEAREEIFKQPEQPFLKLEQAEDTSFADSGCDVASPSPPPPSETARSTSSLSRSPSLARNQSISRRSHMQLARATNLSVAPAQPSRTSGRRVLTVSQLQPGGESDPQNFFDLYCEVMSDVWLGDNPVKLYVTDFTMNTRLYENSTFSEYPSGEKICLQIAFFCKDSAKQLEHLAQGDRVLLENVRMRLDRMYGNLEGHVGTAQRARVTKLQPDHPEYIKLSQAYRELQKDLGEPIEETKAIVPSTTSRQYVACMKTHLSISDSEPLLLNKATDGEFRLRGRVIGMDRDLDDILAFGCSRCRSFVGPEDMGCRECTEDGRSPGRLERCWMFNLRIEIELDAEHFDSDPVDENMAMWMSVCENAGNLVFMNGLTPAPGCLPEAKRLLTGIVDNPSEHNATNPIFDFCISYRREVSALMKHTSLVRAGKSLPWERP